MELLELGVGDRLTLQLFIVECFEVVIVEVLPDVAEVDLLELVLAAEAHHEAVYLHAVALHDASEV